MLGVVDVIGPQATVRVDGRRVKQAEAQAQGEEVLQRKVDVGLLGKSMEEKERRTDGMPGMPGMQGMNVIRSSPGLVHVYCAGSVFVYPHLYA